MFMVHWCHAVFHCRVSVLGVCAEWCLSHPPGVKARPLLSCWPRWGACAAGREGLRKVHEGLTPPAPTQAALETLVHHSQLLQLQHPQQDWSHQTARKYLSAEKMKRLNHFLEQMICNFASLSKAEPSALVLQGQD